MAIKNKILNLFDNYSDNNGKISQINVLKVVKGLESDTVCLQGKKKEDCHDRWSPLIFFDDPVLRLLIYECPGIWNAKSCKKKSLMIAVCRSSMTFSWA